MVIRARGAARTRFCLQHEGARFQGGKKKSAGSAQGGRSGVNHGWDVIWRRSGKRKTVGFLLVCVFICVRLFHPHGQVLLFESRG